jgi:hypothetical protein
VDALPAYRLAARSKAFCSIVRLSNLQSERTAEIKTPPHTGAAPQRLTQQAPPNPLPATSHDRAAEAIVEMRKAGMPLRSIQEALAKEGHQISHVAVNRILKRGARD